MARISRLISRGIRRSKRRERISIWAWSGGARWWILTRSRFSVADDFCRSRRGRTLARLKRHSRFTKCPGWRFSSFAAQDDVVDDASKVSIRQVMEYLKFGMKLSTKGKRNGQPHAQVKLACGSAVFKAFTQVVNRIQEILRIHANIGAYYKIRQPLQFNHVDITLQGTTSPPKPSNPLVHALAECYIPKWEHDMEWNEADIVRIDCQGPAPPRYAAQCAPDAEGRMIGQLWLGPPRWADLELGEVDDHSKRDYDDRADPGSGVRRAGFHARLRVGYAVKGECRKGYDVYRTVGI